MRCLSALPEGALLSEVMVAIASRLPERRDERRAMSEKVLYTAQATVTGGRIEGHGKTSDGELEVDIRIPTDLGGPGGGTNPEQLFAVGYASCFESAIGVGRQAPEARGGDRATSRSTRR